MSALFDVDEAQGHYDDIIIRLLYSWKTLCYVGRLPINTGEEQPCIPRTQDLFIMADVVELDQVVFQSH